MNDETYCCNGKCHQGRDCPRYRANRLDNLIEKLLAALLGVLFLCVLAGYLWATYTR